MSDHELRLVLNNELHGRPGLPVKAPARVTHLAYTLTPTDTDPLVYVSQLFQKFEMPVPPAGVVHHAGQIANGLFKFERHGEFYRISVTVQGKQANGEAISNLPTEWVNSLPGKRLVAIHTHILSKTSKVPNAAELFNIFGHDELACSVVNQGQAMVWTDFRIAADGYSRMVVYDKGMSPMRLGRLTRRLHELETYRMMALLAFPLARQLQQRLGPLENSLSATITDMLSAKGAEEDGKLLTELSTIARDVEELSNLSSYRFAAARAYGTLVAKRISELGEERVQSYQRLGVFLDRRFSPALATCAAVADRISGLALRSERASNLLRTRVDIALEGQNQQLLRSMEASSRQQLTLQQTVEGLSVVAISYYAISIFSKLVEESATYVPWIKGEPVKLVSIPIILVGVWLGLRSLRKKLG
jgi:uncharacterized membrane-anchored protein